MDAGMDFSETIKKDFMSKYLNIGAGKFYSFLLTYAVNKLILIEKGNYLGISPNLEFLLLCDKFIFSYRREGDSNYLEMAKLFRKAAHKIYRIMLKKSLTSYNDKFLNLVKCQ
jgi:hypothetical protein